MKRGRGSEAGPAQLGEMVLKHETASAYLLAEDDDGKDGKWCPKAFCTINQTGRYTKRGNLEIVEVEMEQWKAEELGLV